MKPFKHYLSELAQHVELNISQTLAHRLARIRDVEITSDAQYVTVFAKALAIIQIGYLSVRLALLRLDDETTQNSEKHITLPRFVLELLTKSMSNIVGINGDNGSGNIAMSYKRQIHLLECVNHKFQSAVKGILLEEDPKVF